MNRLVIAGGEEEGSLNCKRLVQIYVCVCLGASNGTILCLDWSVVMHLYICPHIDMYTKRSGFHCIHIKSKFQNRDGYKIFQAQRYFLQYILFLEFHEEFRDGKAKKT